MCLDSRHILLCNELKVMSISASRNSKWEKNLFKEDFRDRRPCSPLLNAHVLIGTMYDIKRGG